MALSESLLHLPVSAQSYIAPSELNQHSRVDPTDFRRQVRTWQDGYQEQKLVNDSRKSINQGTYDTSNGYRVEVSYSVWAVHERSGLGSAEALQADLFKSHVQSVGVDSSSLVFYDEQVAPVLSVLDSAGNIGTAGRFGKLIISVTKIPPGAPRAEKPPIGAKGSSATAAIQALEVHANEMLPYGECLPTIDGTLDYHVIHAMWEKDDSFEWAKHVAQTIAHHIEQYGDKGIILGGGHASILNIPLWGGAQNSAIFCCPVVVRFKRHERALDPEPLLPLPPAVPLSITDPGFNEKLKGARQFVNPDGRREGMFTAFDILPRLDSRGFNVPGRSEKDEFHSPSNPLQQYSMFHSSARALKELRDLLWMSAKEGWLPKLGGVRFTYRDRDTIYWHTGTLPGRVCEVEAHIENVAENNDLSKGPLSIVSNEEFPDPEWPVMYRKYHMQVRENMEFGQLFQGGPRYRCAFIEGVEPMQQPGATLRKIAYTPFELYTGIRDRIVNVLARNPGYSLLSHRYTGIVDIPVWWGGFGNPYAQRRNAMIFLENRDLKGVELFDSRGNPIHPAAEEFLSSQMNLLLHRDTQGLFAEGNHDGNPSWHKVIFDKSIAGFTLPYFQLQSEMSPELRYIEDVIKVGEIDAGLNRAIIPVKIGNEWYAWVVSMAYPGFDDDEREGQQARDLGKMNAESAMRPLTLTCGAYRDRGYFSGSLIFQVQFPQLWESPDQCIGTGELSGASNSVGKGFVYHRVYLLRIDDPFFLADPLSGLQKFHERDRSLMRLL